MKLKFHKYQGTGNDFVIIDHRIESGVEWTQELVARLCDRKFGIGGDGLMLLESAKGYDFKMVYFNSDGRPSSMCGNGGRCLSLFAHALGVTGNSSSFLATDGPHEAKILKPGPDGEVALKMIDVADVERGTDYLYLNTGSPHYVSLVEDPSKTDLIEHAHRIRYSDRFVDKGTNVNIMRINRDTVTMRTYERGVEDETLSCGTGVTAAAISADILSGGGRSSYRVNTRGGALSVSFERSESGYHNIWLTGPAVQVFQGEIDV